MATEQKPPFHKHIFEKMWAIIRDDWAVTKAETRKKMSREEKKQDAGVKWTEFSTHCSSLKT